MKNKWIIVSLIISMILAFFVVKIWIDESRNYLPNDNELYNDDKVNQYLTELSIDNESTIFSRVGIYIDSLQFITSNDVELSGYIWQKIDKNDLEKISFGVIFPESIGGTTMEEHYTYETEDSIIKGWYFETILRQQFNYSKYPLDHKTVWIRMLPFDFSSEMVILPDFASYKATGVEDSFGVSKDIVLNNWTFTETFFDYHLMEFDTSFGLGDEYTRKNHPELSYNIVIERNFAQAIMANLTLMLVIMALLYSLVLMITTEEDKLLNNYGMSASGAIGTASALFFSVLIAHINLRSMFAGQFVYMELFYYLSYVFILAISILIYVFMRELKNTKHMIIRSNAAFFKIIYWPLYFAVILIFTYIWI